MNLNYLLNEADRCVKCGICLPYCPTYKLTLDESDSPRGRIALIQGLASGALDQNQGAKHLDRCLGCLACEAACPSQVRYSHLLDGYRATQSRPKTRPYIHRLISTLPYRSWAGAVLWCYRFSGLRALLRGLAGARFRRLDNLLPPQAAMGRWAKTYHPTCQLQGRVALFTGCVGRLVDRKALNAAIEVLTTLGFQVEIPRQQGCCGAIHQHNGNPDKAQLQVKQNLGAFNQRNLDAVIYLASGCGAQLSNTDLEPPVYEISQFLNHCMWPDEVRLHPIPNKVILHSPCSLKHPLHLEQEPETLLRRIPEIDLTHLAHDDCCGAAGTYILEQPELSDRLSHAASRVLTPTDNRTLATSNTGCALQLTAGTGHHERPLKIVHPIELIRQSMRPKRKK